MSNLDFANDPSNLPRYVSADGPIAAGIDDATHSAPSFENPWLDDGGETERLRFLQTLERTRVPDGQATIRRHIAAKRPFVSSRPRPMRRTGRAPRRAARRAVRVVRSASTSRDGPAPEPEEPPGRSALAPQGSAS